MTPSKLDVREAISFALGGIIGGGIFAVLGVVAAVAGPTAWIAYFLAGIIVIGGFTILFTVYGDLAAITEFASLSFIVVFGIVNAVALTQRSILNRWIAFVGFIGALLFLPLFVWHLYTTEFHVFVLVIVTAIVFLLVEGVYFEREEIEADIESVEKRL